MKLLVQSDDYGITKAVSLGIIEGIKNGIIKNTGIFMNMPYVYECFEYIKPYLDQIAFGIDLNITTGKSLLKHEKIPSLTHFDGSFLTNSENRKLDNKINNFDHVNYDEVYLEFEAQIKKFIEMVGRKPDYIHNHAYFTDTIFKVTKDLGKKYNIISSLDFKTSKMGWYKYGADVAEQIKDYQLLDYILSDQDNFLKMEIGLLIVHCGYVDAQLLKLSSFSTCRVKDLEAITSNEVKKWIEDNDIELITYRDLKI